MSGPAVWVLLRGLARESGHWGDFPAILLQQIQLQQPGGRLLMLDLPGNGALNGESSPTRVAGMVESCRAQLRQLGVQGPVHLLAMSLGAMVATDWAARYPQELSAGVLINTSLQPFSPFYHRLRPLNYLSFLLLSLSSLGYRRREAKVLKMTSNMQSKPDEVLDRWVELLRLHPVGLRNGLRQLLAASRYRASQHRPAVPMLLLCSKVDRLVDWRCSQAISRAWGAPLRMHVQAGHDLPLDDPLWVAQAVGEWLKLRSMQGLQAGKWH
ncbi:alpha/beta fold hydrolase [Roseateles oligotrophus]|uniref:Alpha/beta hydrolase n=1 Tax=Roseateles oligotrophus TaxID=1769250 RepID=A0ABT2YLF4_9BURK|nr:alpha/beta hydrolase [Roseateles oligotrophus]MCV2370893.1 alpha/beta hydrolase [Roseateles oligotrophus]